jgi:hypothetical protein
MFKKDDGIKFQWGDRYIEADQIIDGVGGKYWRDNGNGTITEFTPPELQFNIAKGIVTELLEKPFTTEDSFILVCENEKDAILITAEFNTRFWMLREVSAERMGCKVKLYIPDKVLESTYTPATSD